VGVCTRDEPIEGYCVRERLHVFVRFAGVISNEFDNFGDPWPSVAFILARGMEPESLAHILLMNARPQGSITDAIIQLRYTAREGGDALHDQVVTELKQKAIAAITLAESQNGLARLIDLRHELSDAWNRFVRPLNPSATQQMSLNITRDRFPYLLAAASSITIQAMDLFVQIDPAFKSTYTPDALKFYIFADGTTAGDADLLSMAQWKADTLKGSSKTIGKPVGKWILEGGLGDLNTKIDPGAIVQAFLVVHYSASW